jgi:Clp amino terminal domain, pathogenicity island component
VIREDRRQSWFDEVMLAACLEAERLGQAPVGTEHVLLALLDADAGSVIGEIPGSRVPVAVVRAQAARRTRAERSAHPSADPLSLRALAALAAICLSGANVQGSARLARLAYLTLLSDEDAGAVRILRAIGVSAAPLRLLLALRLGLITVMAPAVALRPPEPLTAAAGDRQVRLRWDAVGDPGCAGYRLYRDGAVLHEGSGTAFLDRWLRNGVTHVYAVAACDADGREGQRSAPVVATPIPEIGVARAAAAYRSRDVLA